MYKIVSASVNPNMMKREKSNHLYYIIIISIRICIELSTNVFFTKLNPTFSSFQSFSLNYEFLPQR